MSACLLAYKGEMDTEGIEVEDPPFGSQAKVRLIHDYLPMILLSTAQSVLQMTH